MMVAVHEWHAVTAALLLCPACCTVGLPKCYYSPSLCPRLTPALQTDVNLPFITADASGAKHLQLTLTR